MPHHSAINPIVKYVKEMPLVEFFIKPDFIFGLVGIVTARTDVTVGPNWAKSCYESGKTYGILCESYSGPGTSSKCITDVLFYFVHVILLYIFKVPVQLFCFQVFYFN